MKLSAIWFNRRRWKSFYTLTRCSNGHFAVQPLLPGVAQLDWVMHYATTLLAPGWRFRSIQNVKFLAPLIPETTVTLQLTWQETSQVLTFCYQRHDGDARHTASSGKIRLCR